MNIVMLCRLYSPHIGGVERHVEGISREAVQEGNRVDIFTLKHDPALLSYEETNGILVHRKTILRLRSRSAQDDRIDKFFERSQLWGWMLWNLPTFIRADVVHIHDVFFWYWPIRILLFWKPVYVTFHGFEAGSLPTNKAKRTRQMITRWTRGNIAVGAWIEKWYGTKADAITYGGGDCDTKTILRLSGKARSAQDDKLKAVFIGRIAEDTGAKIYKKVCESLPNVTLDMFGEGSKNGTIDDSCAIFPRYDIACVSSYLSILEAMQSKTLVVAYAVNDLKYDYLMAHPMASNMIIVRSEEELLKTIPRLSSFARDDTKKMVEQAYKWAREQTWKSVYSKYKNLWREK